uniref:Uncharacterized protein n=1 Tax=Oryza nivara TaxID=4536 RepID=A0A0E0IVB7_ORYNI
MLVVELGVWLIPLTLFFFPCRRIVLLLKQLQGFHRSMTRPRRRASADMLSRFSGLNDNMSETQMAFGHGAGLLLMLIQLVL